MKPARRPSVNKLIRLLDEKIAQCYPRGPFSSKQLGHSVPSTWITRDELQAIRDRVAELEEMLVLAVRLLNLYEIHTEGEDGGIYDVEQLRWLIHTREDAADEPPS